MNQQKRLIAIILAVGLFVVIPLIWFAVSRVTEDRGSETTIIDRDTGERFDPEAEIVSTGGDDPLVGSTQLFGILGLSTIVIDNQLATGFIQDVRQALWQYGDTHLEGEYETLTLRPGSLVRSDRVFTGEVRLGQTDSLVPIWIEVSRNGEAAVVKINEGQNSHNGAFMFVGGLLRDDQYLFTIKQTSTRSTDLTITAFEGYRNPALRYIDELGYTVSDFKITFENYESVF